MLIRTIVLHLLLIVIVRMMGKRQIGQMEASEFVVAMMVADLAAVAMQDIGIPLVAGLVPIFTVLGTELVLSGLTMGSVKFRRIMCGKPVILIDNGKIIQENLRATRVTIDELTGHLREKDVLDITTVQFAILETNGNLSVFPYPRECPASAKDAGITASSQQIPVTIIEDGFFSKENLKKSGKDEAWLKKFLTKKKSTIQETFLLTVDPDNNVVWLKKEGKP
jgi:uncharacterized membrane protein YcaP (DUF421 family)